MAPHIIRTHGEKEGCLNGVHIKKPTQIRDAVLGPPESVHIDSQTYFHDALALVGNVFSAGSEITEPD